ncbi:Thioredoxin domain-containing protein [Cephalotus follicularis]|uniref:Thioredoxin domain-containing protein n=1 Tax=Cephalotus follicularis TaxID=3775 RepID=A0A1Q3B3G9_CEPFO|nr:Thioredoxin domain-containing protein [Cephalotus follicularis]
MKATGTPSLAWSSVVVIVSLLAGASVVHNIYKPDLCVYVQILYLHMAEAAIGLFPSSIRSRSLLQQINPRGISRDLSSCQSLKRFSVPTKSIPVIGFGAVKARALNALSEEGSLKEEEEHRELPASIQLEPICSETQFDRVIAEAQQLEQSVIVVWMASWCRKCIYLKPKLEKLACDYYPTLRFYRVDVNSVPHKLVTRAGVTKMPTIQLWKDGKKQGEVIGGHKAYLVISEVRELIENESAIW